MSIAVLMVSHPPTRPSPIMPEMVRHLIDWGTEVEMIDADDRLTDLESVRVEHDLYILKSGTDLALSLAGSLHAAGANLLNPYPTAVLMRDKIVTTSVLRHAGVPVPETYVTARPEQLAPLLEQGPLVLKPYRGSQGRGVRVLWDAEELDKLPGDGTPLLVQRYYEPQGRDRKIYCIGREIFGVKRVWPARTYGEKLGEPFTITNELHDITIQCGAALGIDLFGIDIIITGGRPLVVDASSFPGFKGVPDAALRLADYLYAALQRVAIGDPLVGTEAWR